MTHDPRPIRPEAVDLLVRLDVDLITAFEDPSLARVTAGGRLLEREERELLESLTPAELQAASAQTLVLGEMATELAGAYREVVELLRSYDLPKDCSIGEAYELLSDDDRARTAQHLQRINELSLLVDPDAMTSGELAEGFLAGRFVVSEWAPDGEPLVYKRVEPDPDRPPPTMAQAIAVLDRLVGKNGQEMFNEVPQPWHEAWQRAMVEQVVSEVVADAVATGWLSENSDGTLDGDLDRLRDEIDRRLGDYEP